MLLTKADLSEMNNLRAAIDGKSDFGTLDEVVKMVQASATKAELDALRLTLDSKVARSDFELYQIDIKTVHSEVEKRFQQHEKEMDEFVETMQAELQSLKNSILQSLNKKADFSMLDRLNELVATKVDPDHLKQNHSALKQELAQDMDFLRNELTQDRASRDLKLLERLDKIELDGKRLSDELAEVGEKQRVGKEERRRENTETADFIKQLIEQTKREQQNESAAIRTEFKLRFDEIPNYATAREVSELKDTLSG